MEARVRSKVSLYGIYGGQNGIVTGFSPSTSVFAPSVTFQQHSTLIFIHLLLLADAPTGNALQKIGEQSTLTYVPVYVIEAYKGSRGMAPIILNPLAPEFYI